MRKLGISPLDLAMFAWLFGSILLGSAFFTPDLALGIWYSWIAIMQLCWLTLCYRALKYHQRGWGRLDQWMTLYFVMAIVLGGTEHWHRVALGMLYVAEAVMLIYLPHSPRKEQRG